MSVSLPVTVGIVNYNGRAILPGVISSIRGSSHPVREIIVADNGSTDGSREWLANNYPEVLLLNLGRNAGSATGRNALLAAASGALMLLLDNDMILEPDALGRLVEIMTSVPEAGICHPEVLDPGDPAAYHYNGGSIHYLGALIPRSRPDPGEKRASWEHFETVSGGAILVHRRRAEEIGGFDEDFFFNWEDGDFSARMTLAGYWCLNVPGALVHHQSKARGVSKAFYQVRNRWFFIIKLYSWRTLVLALPMFCLFEALQAALLIKKGAFGDYRRANLDVIRSLGRLLARRRKFRALKKIRDRDWLEAGPMYVPASMGQGGFQRAGETVFYLIAAAWWKLIRGLC